MRFSWCPRKGNENAVIEITNRVLEQHGYSRRLSFLEGEHLYGRKWFEYFEHLLPDIPKDKHLKLQASCFQISQNQPDIIAKHIKLNEHAEEVYLYTHQGPIPRTVKCHQQIHDLRALACELREHS